MTATQSYLKLIEATLIACSLAAAANSSLQLPKVLQKSKKIAIAMVAASEPNTLSQIARYSIAITLMVPMFLLALPASFFSKQAGWWLVRQWSRMAMALFGITIEVQYELGAEAGPAKLQRGGVVVGLTQQSLLDPTIGIAGMNQRFLSLWNIEYALLPVFGWVSFTLGWVIVRQWPKQAQLQLAKAANYASSGGIVYLSAEGQRSRNGELNDYKKGPAVLAIQAQANIHPLYISGSGACLPSGAWKIRPGHVVLRFLKPLPTHGLSYKDRNALLLELRKLGEQEHANAM